MKPRIAQRPPKEVFGETYLSLAQLAKTLDVSVSMLNRHIKAGRLAVHRIGRRNYVREDDAKRYVTTLRTGPRLSEGEKRVFRGALNNWAMPLYPNDETQLRVRFIRELVNSENFEALLLERHADGPRQAVWLTRSGEFLVKPVLVRDGVPKKMLCPACEPSGDAPMVKLTRKAVNMAEGVCSRCEATWRVHWISDQVIAFINANVVKS